MPQFCHSAFAKPQQEQVAHTRYSPKATEEPTPNHEDCELSMTPDHTIQLHDLSDIHKDLGVDRAIHVLTSRIRKRILRETLEKWRSKLRKVYKSQHKYDMEVHWQPPNENKFIRQPSHRGWIRFSRCTADRNP